MPTWHYALGHRKLPGGKDWYEVHEVYPDWGEHRKTWYTEGGIMPGGETVDEVIEVLEMMLADVRHFDMFEVES